MDHWWRSGGSLVEIWWLTGGDLVAHWWRSGGLLVEIWWIIGGDLVDHWWRYGVSLVQICCLIGGDLGSILACLYGPRWLFAPKKTAKLFHQHKYSNNAEPDRPGISYHK